MSWPVSGKTIRAPLLAENIVVAAQPLAAQAGLQILARGGNAVDAAIASAATLMVVEPVSCGLGADAFALIHDNGSVLALNASGRAPMMPIPDWKSRINTGLGWASVTVPGAVSAWQAMSLRFGKLPFADLFEPAIRYAADGFAVTPVVSRVWRGLRAMYMKFPDLMNSHFQDGRGPESAQFLKFPALAATLDEIAKSGGESFYRGKLARQMAEYARQTGGYLRFEDLAEHRAEWVEPISAGYHGSTIHEMPPNSQGVAALIALAILERFDLAEEPDSAEAIHFQIEAMKLAFAETYAHVGDPSSMGVSTAELLSPSNIARLAKLIDRRHAKFPDAQQSSHGGGTSYLCCGDRDGLVVSYIQSSGPGFGSGILEPRTGIVFQSRGMAFNTNSSHPNVYAPGKRVFHTNAPAIMTRGSQFFAAFGLMGWSMQPQAHVQFVVRAVDHLQAPTTLVDAPRWRIALEEPAILIEPGLEIAAKMLLEKGHRIVPTEKFLAAATPFGSHLMFGGAAYMQSLHHGYAGAADPRRDGAAVGY